MQRMLINGVVLHHDNTQPYMAAVTVETIQKLKSQVPHPAYTVQISPHLITIFSDCSNI